MAGENFGNPASFVPHNQGGALRPLELETALAFVRFGANYRDIFRF